MGLFNQLFTFVSLDTQNEDISAEQPKEKDMPEAPGKSNNKIIFIYSSAFIWSSKSRYCFVFIGSPTAKTNGSDRCIYFSQIFAIKYFLQMFVMS